MSTRQPTIRQKKAVELLVENVRNTNKNETKSMGEILQQSGYSKAISEAPTKVTQSVGFQLAMEQAGITDEKLTRVLDEGLLATKRGEPDYSVRHKYLETAVKLKGHLNAQSTTGNTYNTFVQQNNYDPNIPENKDLVIDMTEYLMQKTKLE